MPAGEQVTKLLIEWNSGNEVAKDLLVPLLYEELRRLAEGYLRHERSAATLQPTALVHEAYLRLIAQDLPDWQSRSHFFGVAANLMRQILVDHARRQKSAKRGGGAPKVSLDEALDFAPEKSSDIIALDDALHSLAAAALTHAGRALEASDPSGALAKGRPVSMQRSLTPRGSAAMGLVYAELARASRTTLSQAWEDRNLGAGWLQKSLEAWRQLQSDPAFSPPQKQEMQRVEAALAQLQKTRSRGLQ